MTTLQAKSSIAFFLHIGKGPSSKAKQEFDWKENRYSVIKRLF